MSTTAIPTPAIAVPLPAVVATRARHTLLGFVGTRRVVEIILTAGLALAGAFLLFGANFGLNMVTTTSAPRTSPSRPRAMPA